MTTANKKQNDTFYHYIRTYNREPKITVCIKQQDGYIGVGFSICVAGDRCVKLTGRDYSTKNALKALEQIEKKEKTYEHMGYPHHALETIFNTPIDNFILTGLKKNQKNEYGQRNVPKAVRYIFANLSGLSQISEFEFTMDTFPKYVLLTAEEVEKWETK